MKPESTAPALSFHCVAQLTLSARFSTRGEMRSLGGRITAALALWLER
jgi:hypothetical protein